MILQDQGYVYHTDFVSSLGRSASGSEYEARRMATFINFLTAVECSRLSPLD